MEFTITLTGTQALLMHNARLANPLDDAAKAVKRLTGKRTKTEDDYLELARVEFAGGLYLDPDGGPYVPADNIWRCLQDAAKKVKKGVKVKEGVLITTLVNPLAYSGPREVDALWKSGNFHHFASAKVGMQRVNRCRPFFRDWKVDAEGIIDTNILELEELVQIADIAGQQIGLGDWRPKYGRFTAQVTER